MKYFSTFSGIGGFEIGIQRAFMRYQDKKLCESTSQTGSEEGQSKQCPELSMEGLSCVGYSEIDKYAIKVYERNFKHDAYGDITTIKADELPDFDCLVGGFPCQAFSIAGKRAGFSDTRGTLFFDLARILQSKQPRLFVFENVKGLLSHDGGQSFKTIIQTIDELGYDCQWQVLNSKNHGVPQNRERVIIVGHLRGTPRPEVFPIGQSNRDDNEQVGRTVSPTLMARDYKGIGGQPMAIAYKPKIRRLTPVECERLQGFPDDWTKYGVGDEPISDSQRYKMAGNAVTVNVIEHVFERIFNSIDL